jgi:hypothetical protein
MYEPSADADARYGSIVGLCGTEEVDVATEETEDGDMLVSGRTSFDSEGFFVDAQY